MAELEQEQETTGLVPKGATAARQRGSSKLELPPQAVTTFHSDSEGDDPFSANGSFTQPPVGAAVGSPARRSHKKSPRPRAVTDSGGTPGERSEVRSSKKQSRSLSPNPPIAPASLDPPQTADAVEGEGSAEEAEGSSRQPRQKKKVVKKSGAAHPPVVRRKSDPIRASAVEGYPADHPSVKVALDAQRVSSRSPRPSASRQDDAKRVSSRSPRPSASRQDAGYSQDTRQAPPQAEDRSEEGSAHSGDASSPGKDKARKLRTKKVKTPKARAQTEGDFPKEAQQDRGEVDELFEEQAPSKSPRPAGSPKRTVRRSRATSKSARKAVYTCCRIRPLTADEGRRKGWDDVQQITGASDSRTVQVQDVEGASFKFDAVFAPGAQTDVFEKVKDIVQGVVDGNYGSIFAYGQNGAGKSYTMHGGGSDSVVPQAFLEIFTQLDRKASGLDDVSVRLSVMEIRDDAVVDLLDDSPSGPQSWTVDQIRVDERTGNVSLKGLTELECRRAGECTQRCLEAAGKIEALQPTRIVMATVVRESAETQDRVMGKLVMCDLIGSEVGKRHAAAYEELCRLREVLEALSGKVGEVPYGNHLLTSLLQDVLGGGASKTALIVHLVPTLESRMETLRSLQYGTGL